MRKFWYKIKVLVGLDSPPVVYKLNNENHSVYYPVNSDNQANMFVKDANNQGITFMGERFKVETQGTPSMYYFVVRPDKTLSICVPDYGVTLKHMKHCGRYIVDTNYLDLSF